MKRKILIFGGTSEGRALCEALSASGRPADVCTATPYGGALVEDLPHIRVRSARLSAAEMAGLMAAEGFCTVVDATHPYAREVTLNIREACAATGAEYIRIVRDESGAGNNAAEPARIKSVPDMDAAVDYLAGTEGKVFLATGSKELAKFCRLQGYADRLYARVLPDAEVIRRCNELGFCGGHLIAMQGPFTRELNLALLRQFGCRFMVTKNTGKAGGLDDKISAALEAGAEVVLVERPLEESGCTLDEALGLLGVEPFTGADAGGRDEG